MNLPKLSVLQVIPELNISGASQGCIDVSNYLSERKVNNYIMTKGGCRSNQININNLLFFPVHSKNLFIMIYNIFVICYFIISLDIDIVHARSRAPAWSCYFATVLTNTKFVTTFHGTYGYSNAIKKFYNSIMLRTDGTIAISNHIKNEIKQYSVQPKLLKTIYNGIDLDKFNHSIIIPDTILKKLKNYFGNDENIIRILLPGRLTYWKGHNDLLQAASFIKKQKPNYKFKIVFVGDGSKSYRKKILEFSKKLNLQDDIIIVPSTDDIQYYYSFADLVISSATEPEAFGRISVESQAMGKFCIASNHGGSTETIMNGQTGFLYKPKDANDLSNKIIKAIEEKKIRNNNISNHCIQNIKNKFDKKLMNLNYLNFYFEILGKHKYYKIL